MPFVEVLAPPVQGVRRGLDRRRELIVGRDAACDLVVPNKAVSRKHARFFFDGHDFCVEDLASSHGTFVNGRRINSAARLQDGDRIHLHSMPLVFWLRDEGHAPIPSVVENRASRPTAPISSILTPPEVVIFQGRLRSLIEIFRRLGSSLNVDEILPRILDLLFEIFPQAAVGEIQLADPQGQLRPVALKHGREDDSAVLTRMPLHNEVAQRVFKSGRGTLRTSEGQGAESVLDDSASSVVCVPMLGHSRRSWGIILIETEDLTQEFQNDDLDLVETVGVLAAQALEYSHAHQIVLKHVQAQKQMEIARQIQLRMLPPAFPTIPGYSFAAHYEPADAVGGDLYFLDCLPDNRLVICVADACGHSLPAALSIMQFAAELRHCIASCPTVKTALHRLNRFVCSRSEGFITFCLCLVDVVRHSLTVVNAGHPPPLRRRQGQVALDELLAERPSLPLGVHSAEEFHPLTVALELGDEVLIYTDGVIEAMTPDRELYGRKRLRQLLEGAPRGGVQSLVSVIVEDVARFRGKAPIGDDSCIVALSRTGA